MIDTSEVLAAIERLQEIVEAARIERETSPMRVKHLEFATKSQEVLPSVLSALEALVKMRGTKFTNFVEYQKLAIEAEARLADFVAAVGK